MIRVLLADDQSLIRMGFRLILGSTTDLQVVGEAENGLQAVDLAVKLDPDVVLMDVRMPRMDGIEATRRLLSEVPDTKVLALTTFDIDEFVYAAVQAGAGGFLLKDVSPDDLVHAVHVVARGEAMLSPVLTRRLLDRFTTRPPPGTVAPELASLTEREIGVLRRVARGESNADIGRNLFLSEATVKTYVSRMLAKLSLRDRVQLAVLAYETGLVQPGESAG